ncbi:MAG TPA: glycoside hydrolase family 3 protein [Longimicrobiaceae bacterium]|nr:glycoside hydrolase family 3 protein [Longimicrobiaceae bacterium]
MPVPPPPRRRAAAAPLLALALHACGEPTGARLDPPPPYRDTAQPVSARVEDLLGRMTLDEKLGQMMQVERASLSGGPRDLAEYHVGSVLSGGGSAPTPNTPAAWADMYDAFQKAALGSRLGIPILYGIDAVHGHNNVRGATIFPHNIGLGAARDPDLVRRIGQATAAEVAGTGIDWTFAPCLCVVRDVRWGRTYESFGEDPEIATSLAAVVTGLQGPTLGGGPTSILATAKHFLGDGGTAGGRDQGDTRLTEAELRRIHLPPFEEAVRRDVGAVMVTYSAWNGEKVHGHRRLVTGVLKEELGFRGIVVSDWGGVDQIDGLPGFSPADVRAAVNAGIDMVMVPHDYRGFRDVLRREVQEGRVPVERIDDAVRRILTRKFEMGLFERPYTDRAYTGTVGSAAHRALAREAVRRSLVLLKNDGVLPLSRSARVLVAGRHADDVGLQSGGWTIDWQGGSGNVTPGTTILQGIRAAAPGAAVTYAPDGRGAAGHDVAVVVVGEEPYAEYHGDRGDGLGLDPADLETLAAVEAAGVPVVVVLVSGRPLVVTGHLPGWSALVAAWLPGTEGAGVADVLFGDHAPTGRLPVSWPRSASQLPLNVGDAGYDPLFAYGFGLTYP